MSNESLELIYEYFVAFSRVLTTEDGSERTIFENKVVTMSRELTAIEQIYEIEQLVAKQYNYSQVTLINFILLKRTTAPNPGETAAQE